MKNKIAAMGKGNFFSLLWIFLMFNYLYCDLIGLMDSHLLQQYLQGSVDGLKIDEGFLLMAGVLMEISMVMIVLSRILPYKSNRIANMIAAFISTAVMIMTLFIGTTTMYYFFFALIEIATSTYILISSYAWREEEVGDSIRQAEVHSQIG
ncbi:MAG: DUF6326 family protein [Bacteroidota bacterium]